MAESIVKVPEIKDMDYDFIAFSFKGKHSYEDFGIYRTSDSNTGYSENLSPSTKDQTMDVPGQVGQYYLGTQVKTKEFNIKFAFDNLSENMIKALRAWLSGEELGDLWFAEAPYKVYTAKVNGIPTINTFAFYQDGKRVYKGTGQIKFICYYPYAHTPTWIEYRGAKLDGKLASSYVHFSNHEEIEQALPGRLDFIGTHELVDIPTFPNYSYYVDFEYNGKVYDTISASNYGPQDWKIKGLDFKKGTDYSLTVYYYFDQPASGATPQYPSFEGWRDGKQTIKILTNPVDDNVKDWLLKNLKTHIPDTPYGQLPFTFKAKLKRPGYHKLILHANNGTNDKFETECVYSGSSKTASYYLLQNVFSPVEQGKGLYIKGWTRTKNGTTVDSDLSYGNTTNGSGTKTLSFEADTELYAVWSNSYKVAFAKALQSYARDTYISAFLGDSYTNHTGKQEYYGCRISLDGEHFTDLEDYYYKGKFNTGGEISDYLTLPYGAKIQVWVQDDPNYRKTTCHILENGKTIAADNDPVYTYTLRANTQIIFDWRLSGIYKFGTSNWNCYINTFTDTVPDNILNGIYQGAT